MKSTSEGIAVAGVTVRDLRPWRRSRRRLIEAGRNPHGLEESGLFEHATLQLFAPLALQCEEPLFAAERLRFGGSVYFERPNQRAPNRSEERRVGKRGEVRVDLGWCR